MLKQPNKHPKRLIIEQIISTGLIVSIYEPTLSIWFQPTKFMISILYNKTVNELNAILLNLEIELSLIVQREYVLIRLKGK